MNTFWQGLAKVAVKVAIYAAGHPDEVKAIISAVVSAKQ